jgi:hypothetical protein
MASPAKAMSKRSVGNGKGAFDFELGSTGSSSRQPLKKSQSFEFVIVPKRIADFLRFATQTGTANKHHPRS